jgi:ubiquinone/menaquinone biosynthesis C-methylase UbiE/uncharacterized protein YbaR (Trm112 family)
MKESLLELLCVPGSEDEELVLQIEEKKGDEIIKGTLEGVVSKKRFSIVNGIPRFVSQEVSDYDVQTKAKFETQWKNWGDGDVIFGRTKAESIEYFNAYCGAGYSQKELKGKVVLDAGCGHGRFAEIMAEGEVKLSIGVDLGEGIEFARKRTEHLNNVQLVQADIVKLPFKKKVFDYIWCDGVLMATKNTKIAFEELSKHVAPSGALRMWVYPVESPAWEYSQRFIRSFTTRMPTWMLMPLCYLAVPLLAIVPTYSKTQWPKNKYQDVVQVIWDWYSPKYQWHHTPEEVKNWFSEAGFISLESHSLKTSIFGIRE